MQILVNGAEGVQISEALDTHIRRKLSRVDRRFGERLTRLQVFVKDVNADKGGIDKVCTMEARPAGLDPVAVEAQAVDAYTAAQVAADKLEKALARRLEKD